MAIDAKNLAVRAGAGGIYVVLSVVLSLVSWWTCALMVVILAGCCCYEFLKMSKQAGHKPYMKTGITAAILIPVVFTFACGHSHVAFYGMLPVFVMGAVMLLRYVGDMDESIVDVSLTFFSYIYTGLMLSSILLFRHEVAGFQGGLMVVIFMFSVWMNDAFAYVGGSAFGKHKFAPKISPKKTWEGVLFGFVGSVLFWMLIPLLVPQCGFGYIWAAICGVVCAFAGILGDLTESHFKREFGVKDAGNIMPGHGGILDRIDSMIFASCAAYGLTYAAPYIFDLIGFTL